jgi:hypothetical protein
MARLSFWKTQHPQKRIGLIPTERAGGHLHQPQHVSDSALSPLRPLREVTIPVQIILLPLLLRKILLLLLLFESSAVLLFAELLLPLLRHPRGFLLVQAILQLEFARALSQLLLAESEVVAQVQETEDVVQVSHV